MIHDGPCMEGNDPRRKGTCYKCCKPVPENDHTPGEYASQPAHPADEPRNEPVEYEIQRQIGLDPHLVEYAHLRCDKGPVRRYHDRDLLADMAEELEDAVNYATWAMMKCTGEQGEKYQATAHALRLVSEAYVALRFARSL